MLQTHNNVSGENENATLISKLLETRISKNVLSRYFVPAAVAVNVDSKVDVPPTTDPIPDLPPIPEPLPMADIAAEAARTLNALGEPTFASLGLGGWTPVGIVQNCFEYLHVTLGIPWWQAIVIGKCFYFEVWFRVFCK